MAESLQPRSISGELRTALATVLETRPLPPERFKTAIKGEVTAIKTIGERICVIQKEKDGSYRGVLINERNEIVEVPLDPSSRQIANMSRTSVPYEQGYEGHCEPFKALLTKIGFSGREIDRYLVEWKRKIDGNMQILKFENYNNMISKEDLLKAEEFYLHAGDWDIETRTDKTTGQKRFALRLGDSVLTVDDKGRVSGYKEYATAGPGETALPKGQLIVREKNLFHIKDGAGKTTSTLSGISPAIDPSNPATVYYIDDGKVFSIDTSGLADRTTKPIPDARIQVTDPQEIIVDNNGNFLIIRDSKGVLHIVDKEGGQTVKNFSDTLGPITINEDGDIIYIDGKNQLREIETNFKAIPKGGNAEAQKQRDAKLIEMQERFTKLDLSKLYVPKTATVTEDTVAQTLRQTISTQVIDKINGATNAEEVERVLDQLQALKGQPEIQPLEHVVDEFVTQARNKLSQINTATFEGQLTTFHGSLQDVHTVGDTIDLDRRYAELTALRQKIEITDPAKRKEIDKALEAVRTQKESLIIQYQGVLLQTVQQTLPTIEQIVKECGSIQEISTLGADPQVQQFELMLTNIRDPKVRREMRDRYNEVKQVQRSEMEVKERAVEEQRRLGWAQTIEEARADLEEIGKEITRIADAREVSRYERNPLVTTWRAKLLTLPPELRELEEKRLDIVLSSRRQDIGHRKNLGAVGEAGELKFGDSTFPIFKEPPRIWQSKITPIPGALPGLGYLVYEDAYGRVFDPHAVVNTDTSLPQTQEMIAKYRQQADEYFEGMKRKMPEFNDHWVITDYHMEKLEEITDVLNIQRDNHEGIVILEGEAGTGKNVMGDMLANLANMELVQIPCNENTAKEDLVYDFQFDPEKGTYKLPSRLIEAIQTPGTIVFFDEINALKPGITKLLNSLFDYHRKIFITEGGKTKEIAADPTVLFLGAMNPQNYLGVKPLSPEVKSRARVIDFNYPPFDEQKGGRTTYHPHEALMLSRYMGSLSSLKPQEFKDLWDFVVNKNQSSPGSLIAQGNPVMQQQVERMYDVLRVANKLRSMYEAYQTGESNEPLDFPTSLREMTAIVMEMNHGRDVRKAIERVILPKIDDRSQRKFVKETIAAILPTT